MSVKYFPGLNGLRCIAACMVFVSHVELFKLSLHLPSLYLAPYFKPWLGQFGQQGVGLFFVLSGFLITYLLLEEKARTGKIHVLRFYLRRILRIWPLYFLMVLLGFFVLPLIGYPPDLHVKLQPHFWMKFLLMVFFLPNLILSVFGVLFPVAPLWSIGTEEQFYLAWPHLLARNAKRMPRFLFLFIAGCVLLKLAMEWGSARMPASYPHWKLPFKVVFDAIRFDSMAWGSLAAYWLREREDILRIVYRRDVQAVTLVLLLALYAVNPDFHALHDLIYGGLYAVVILNVATNPQPVFKPVHASLEYLGRVSYGIYVYHTPILFAMLYLLKPHAAAWYFQPALYVVSFAATVAVAGISYRYFESPILACKGRFAPQS